MAPSKLIKTLIGIAGVLAFAILMGVLLRRPQSPEAPFDGLLEKTEKITLQTGPTTVELARDSATPPEVRRGSPTVVGGWTVTSSTRGIFRADAGKVKTLLTRLNSVRVEDVISERPESAAEFEINRENAALITLYGAGQTKLASGVFGKQAPDFGHLYFKYPDKPAIYLARGAFRGELGGTDLKAWRDRALLNFAEDQVLTVLLEGPGFKTALARSSDTWSVNGKIVEAAPVWGLLGQIAHLRAEDFVDLSQHPGLTPDTLRHAVVSVQTRDGRTHRLLIGRTDPAAKRVPVAADQDPGAAWVPETAVKSILLKPSDFRVLSSPRLPAGRQGRKSSGDPAPAKMDSR